MRVGTGGSAAAAAAAAAAEAARRAAEAARKVAEAARKAAEAAKQKAAQAAKEKATQAAAARREASTANKQASEAAKHVRTAKDAIAKTKDTLTQKQAQLDKGAQLSHPEREKLQQETQAAREKLSKLEKVLPTLEQKAGTLRASSLEASMQALTAEKAANSAAKAAGRPEPFKSANTVEDVFDAGSLSAKDQEKLFGTASVVTPQEAAQSDARRVSVATEADVANGAESLHQQLAASTDPAYRKALIQESQGSIEEMGRQISLDDGRPGEDTMKAALSSLARAGELGGREGAQTLATAFARQIPDHDLDIDDGDRLGGAFKSVIGSKNGATFAAELAHSLRESGKPESAEEVSKLTRESLEDAREDFEDAQEKVDELNGELGRYVAGFGPAMTKEEQSAAIESFRERHAEEYKAWEEAGGTYASMLEGASAALEHPVMLSNEDGEGYFDNEEALKLQGEAKKAMELLPEIGQTKAGLETIATAVEKKGQGEQTFLDSARDVAQTMDDAKGYLDKVSGLVVKGTALKAVELGSTGKTAQMKSLMAGLEGQSGLLGVDREQLKGLTSLMGEFKPGMTDAQLKTLGSHIDRQISEVSTSAGLDPNGPTAQAFKGLGVVMGGVSAVQGFKDWNQADLSQKISTLGNALNVGADGGSLALDVFGKSSSFLKAAGPAGAMVSALGEGLGAVDAFKNGEYAEGLSSSAMALGGALMAVPSGVTQLVGGALVVGGAVAKFFLGKSEEHADEDDLKAFLEAGGVDSRVADAINDLNGDRQNYGDVLTQTAQSLGTTPQGLMQHLATLDDDQIEGFQDVMEMFGDRDEPEKSGALLGELLRGSDLAPPVATSCVVTPPPVQEG